MYNKKKSSQFSSAKCDEYDESENSFIFSCINQQEKEWWKCIRMWWMWEVSKIILYKIFLKSTTSTSSQFQRIPGNIIDRSTQSI